MTYEMYRNVFLYGAVAAGVMLLVSVILFFAFNIPKVVNDLTGRTARKAIENIRRQNEATGDKTYKSSPVNMQRGKLTDKISKSGRLIPNNETPFGTGVITEKISTQRLAADEAASETTVLSQGSETTVLNTGVSETTVLNAGFDETSVLSTGYSETTVLQSAAEATIHNVSQNFEIEYEITFIHTNEVIA